MGILNKMSDLKVLFHQPEELTDQELTRLRSTLRFQNYSPFLSASFLGMTSAIADVHVLGRQKSMRRVALFFSVGYIMGCNIAQTVSVNTLYNRNWDQDILDAF